MGRLVTVAEVFESDEKYFLQALTFLVYEHLQNSFESCDYI